METPPSNARPLALGTVSFAVCFAVWGLVSAFAPVFRKLFELSATQTALLVAVPVLLGSLARLPMGMLTDRFGGRAVFTILMAFVAVPPLLVPLAGSYGQLIAVGFLLGMAGSSFAVGVGFVSRWTPPAKQGGALGVYGLGNIGQSAAVFLGPLVAASIGWQTVFRGAAALVAIWTVIFALLARDAPSAAKPKGLGEMLGVLRREPLSWLLGAFYFLTFGGFVAFAIYLPTLMRDQFELSSVDAGFRAAGFVVLATLMRPVGGWLADHIGGARVLAKVFISVVPFALLLAWPTMVPFTVGALGCAALLGVGNGAVFKLVPQYFPRETGTVTGLVGALGGLGGFFPPLLLGVFRDRLGVVWPGFVLLAAVAAGLWWVNGRVLIPRQEKLELHWPPELTRVADRLRAGSWATLGTALLVASVVVGSRNLQNFDPALVVYTFGTVFAAWGVIYHYNVWLQKPPTQLFWRRGWQAFRELGLARSTVRTGTMAVTDMAAQGFIRKRSRLRWWMHMLLSWGCLLAVAITFPLVFGWMHFRTLPEDQHTYVTYVFGFPMMRFRLHTVFAWMLFHALDISAVMVLGGIVLSLWRRMRDQDARALQTFAADFLPLAVLFAISITGLALTVSSLWLGGAFYGFMSILHAITVIGGLLYLPFGKFFHVFQRPAQLGVKLYHEAADRGAGAICARCGERFASRAHIDDLKTVLPAVGFDYTMPGPAGHWQEICPACKRKSLAAAQLRLLQRPALPRNGHSSVIS